MEKLNKANELATRIEKTKQEIAMYEKALTIVKHTNSDMSATLFKSISDWLELPIYDALNAMQDGLTTDLGIIKEYLKKYEQELENMFK